ncbi:MAG: DUF3574 domain-containing protein [Oscillospiraceae bacterium]
MIATAVLFYRINVDTNGLTNSTKSKYALYIGTNDKDTNQLEIPLEECKAIVKDVCIKYTTGFTIVDATGVWADDSERIADEISFICYFNDVTEDTIISISDDMLEKLDQNSILIEHQNLDFNIYSKN